LAALGHRVIAVRGWDDGAAAVESESLVVAHEEPHHLLFPRTSLVVHHGGAGTTTVAAASGVPQLIVPHLGDQAYHGLRVEELGCGARSAHVSRATAQGIAETVQRLTRDAACLNRARELAGRIRVDGAARAAELLETT
jgi:UDP:flavonoid glycosyltransferase YjiC (YdhE family)